MLIVLYFATCYEYTMSKCCQYTTNDLKVAHVGMKEVLIKEAQSSFLKTIAWTKKVGKTTKVGNKCIFLPLKVENSYQDLIFIQVLLFK